MGKLIAKKYCEGKPKRTLKKELKELERVIFERIIYEKNIGRQAKDSEIRGLQKSII